MAQHRYLDELVNLTPAMDMPILACRGTIYQVLRARGESDFVAGTFAFNTPAARRPAARRPGIPITARQLHAFYEHGPAGIARGAAA